MNMNGSFRKILDLSCWRPPQRWNQANNLCETGQARFVDCCLISDILSVTLKDHWLNYRRAAECDLLSGFVEQRQKQNRREWFISVRLYNEHSVFSSVFCNMVTTPTNTERSPNVSFYFFIFWEPNTYVREHFFIYFYFCNHKITFPECCRVVIFKISLKQTYREQWLVLGYFITL